MSDEKRIIDGCVQALEAARPFVQDGRPQSEAEKVVKLIDSALGLAESYGETGAGRPKKTDPL